MASKRLSAFSKRAIPANIARLLLPRRGGEEHLEDVAAILAKLPDGALAKLWRLSRTPGVPMLAQRDKSSPKVDPARAKKILVDGLKYHEHDGHDMPKRVARDALEALGVKRDDQP